MSDAKQFYHCFACGAHGDAVGFVMRADNLDFLEAVERLAGQRGLGGGATAHDARSSNEWAIRKDQDDIERRRRAAQALFLAARPLTLGDPVCLYLAGRGIELARLPRLPRALRFHPAFWNSESRRAWPAMVAAVVAGAGRFVAAHRTFLDIGIDGRVRKAPIAAPKLSLGAVAGGAIRLARGADGRPWRQADPVEEPAAAEGIEDGLAAALLMPDRRVVATVSLGNLRNIALPPRVTRLLWLEQNDPPGSGARKQLTAIVGELRARGIALRFLRPPVFVKDLKEYYQRISAAA